MSLVSDIVFFIFVVFLMIAFVRSGFIKWRVPVGTRVLHVMYASIPAAIVTLALWVILLAFYLIFLVGKT